MYIILNVCPEDGSGDHLLAQSTSPPSIHPAAIIHHPTDRSMQATPSQQQQQQQHYDLGLARSDLSSSSAAGLVQLPPTSSSRSSASNPPPLPIVEREADIGKLLATHSSLGSLYFRSPASGFPLFSTKSSSFFLIFAFGS